MKFGLSKIFKSADPQNFPTIKLDETKIAPEVEKLETYLRSKIEGQDRAIKQFVSAYEVFLTNMQRPDGPVGVLLFLGPTGVGKTRIVEVFSEYLWGTSDALIKVDCSEFQQSHEIAKLIGAPPGYVGHTDTKPIITKERLEKYWKSGPKFTTILFDEIEKAHDNLHRVLLGINGAGRLTTGKNDTIDMKPTLIVMTSNLGSRSISGQLSGKTFGFQPGNKTEEDIDAEIYKKCKDAVKAFFSAEFFNRIDRMVAFRPLTDENFKRILDMELGYIQDRIIKAKKFIILDVSLRAKTFFLKEGVSREYGARELRRTLERYLVRKLTRAFSTNQAVNGDMVLADAENDKIDITIMKGVVDLPYTETTADTSTETWIRPESVEPFESLYKPGRCGRCGQTWSTIHICADIFKLTRMKEAVKNPPPTVTEEFWKRNTPKPKAEELRMIHDVFCPLPEVGSYPWED